ncbi:hypothetical protein RHECNPAF_1260071 [Rhizobium etli CNPAF512]|nr:hypothetical protein RHECNPAF_1260071 [Rhizobium etli CNPAF512]
MSSPRIEGRDMTGPWASRTI